MQSNLCAKHRLFLDLIQDLYRTLYEENLSYLQGIVLLYKELYRSTHILVLHRHKETPFLVCKKNCCRKTSCLKIYKLSLSTTIPELIETELDKRTKMTTEEIDAIYNDINPEITQRVKKEIQTCTALRKLSLNDITNVLYKDEWIPTRLLKVIDGDTISVAVLTGNGNALKISVRVFGIDCPEKARASEKEIKCGLLIKQHLEGRLDSIVKVKFLKPDMYGGRWLGHVRYTSGHSCCSCGCGLQGVCLGAYLISEKLARTYNGEKKTVWTDMELDGILARFS